MSDKYKEKKFTTSKKILWVSLLLFIATVALAVWFSYEGRDTTVFMYILPITGGITGATVVFYLNKSKMENIFRFKISFLEYKIDLVEKHPEKKEIIDEDLTSVNDSLNSKIDSTMREAIDENIDIQSY